MKNFFLIISIFLYLTACQSAKEALTGKKKNTGDEFLVEKKSPLVLPPDYGELPKPGEVSDIEVKSNNDEIQITLGNSELLNEEAVKNSKPTSIEKSVLEKIE